MRRMLDPKEVGGGGSIQLYHHHIYLLHSSGSDHGYIYFDYDSTNAEQFTADTLIAAMQGKTVIGSGYIIMSQKKRIPVDITSINNKLRVRFSDIDTAPGLTPSPHDFAKNTVAIQDEVYLIN